jgi:hypothetical protein
LACCSASAKKSCQVSLEQESQDPKRDKWANLDILRIVRD